MGKVGTFRIRYADSVGTIAADDASLIGGGYRLLEVEARCDTTLRNNTSTVIEQSPMPHSVPNANRSR